MPATKKKGAVRKAPPRKKRAAKKKAPTREQLLELDPWHFDRDHPVFAAICKVIMDHPDLVYYPVDWRPWLHGQPDSDLIPRDVRLRQLAVKRGRAMVPDPDPICGSYTRPYRHGGGGGYMERFAVSVIATMHGVKYRTGPDRLAGLGTPAMSCSEAVLAVLRASYDTEARPLVVYRGPRRKPQTYQCKRSFERVLRDAGFNARMLARFDREVARHLKTAEKQAAKAAAKTNPTPTPTTKKETHAHRNRRPVRRVRRDRHAGSDGHLLRRRRQLART